MVKKTFLTFGNSYYNGAIQRITEQIKKINIFDNVISYNETTIKECNDFWEKHSKFILSNWRGFGYWLWKSYLIDKTLKNMENDDILFYVDAGCEINYNARDKIIQNINRVNDVEIMATSTGHIEQKWTKRDLLILLDADKEQYKNSIQVQSTVLLIKKTEKTVNFIKEWYTLCENYKNIDDSPSIYQDYSDFREHRHDQSVFSLLCKKYNMVNFELDPIYFNNTHNYNEVINNPIIAARNQGLVSIFNELN
jgi:hypothetical protein